MGRQPPLFKRTAPPSNRTCALAALAEAAGPAGHLLEAHEVPSGRSADPAALAP